jgi:superfamily II DNA/RNA helicase
MPFASLGLSGPLLEGVRDLGYSTPTPIQEKAIPEIIAGRDVVGCAQTGTGKTAAFVLPLLQRLPKEGVVRGLVVTPTRELASQVEQVATTAARHTGHSVTAIYGGVRYEKQLKALKHGTDLLVATPGRLLDLVQRKAADLSRVQILVLDEADRMLDMGFWPDVRRILRELPRERQNLLFSATVAPEVIRVASSTLKDPAWVEVGERAKPVESVAQWVYPVDAMQKYDLLAEVISAENAERMIVFTRTKQRADIVAKVLERKGLAVRAIHSDRNQTQRQKALDGFKDGRFNVLVATDIVARGIDVEGVSHVVNFDVPQNPEDYVHRIGRTARAGASGDAITLLSAEEMGEFRAIEGYIDRVIPARDVEDFEYRRRPTLDPDRPAKTAPRAVFSSGVMGRRRSGGIRRR